MDFSWVAKYSGLFAKAFVMTLKLGALAVFFGSILGLIVGILSTTKTKILLPIRAILRVYVELLRGCPLIVQLFMVYFGLPYIGINVSVSVTTFVVFTLYSGAYIAEIVRSGIESIPTGQWEAGYSLNLKYPTILMRIIMPQTIKLALASLVGFYIGMIKDTSLASIIGYTELVRGGQGIMNQTGRPFEVYLIVGICYFIICFPLSKLVTVIERKVASYDRT
ncbi:MAG: amino acid ABC transporter permease [Clostridia bacterium]|nr:amino acid ABC transporter permease [Clostridia bacterium]